MRLPLSGVIPARAALSAVFVLVLLAAGCGSGSAPDGAGEASGDPDRIVAHVASYDLAVGEQRFMVGLVTQENELIGGGEVDLKFAYLGTREQEVTGKVVAESKAAFLPIPSGAGSPDPALPDSPSLLPTASGTGVYAAQASFDKAGYWGVVVEADVQGEKWTGRSTFEVSETHLFPWIGEDAPRSENLTVTSTDVPPTAIDSRAREGKQVPDPQLHGTTVAASIASGKPALVVVSTPTYCVSRFCGPITDMVQGLSESYADRANFVHIEVWRDFEDQQINQAAAEWMLRGDTAVEPWVFLVDGDGKIAGRWDNVATQGEIEPALQALKPS